MILSLAVCTATVSRATTSDILGDVDGDDSVTILDATAIQRHLASLITLDSNAVKRGKVCGDNMLTILDATCIQRYLAGIIDRFPAEADIPTEPPTNLSTEDCVTFHILVMGDGASIAYSDKDTVSEGREVATLTAVPAEGYRFKEWSIAGNYEIASGKLTDKVIKIRAYSDVTAQAVFEAIPDEEPTKVKNNITIYFSNNLNWSTVNAYIYKQSSGTALKAWPGSAMKYVKTNNEGEKVYSATVDVSKYDRVIFNNGTDQTTDTPVTKSSSGYFINSKKSYSDKYLCGVYPYGQSGEGKVTTVSMDYPDGYKKKVYIWTPEGYNAADKSKKYSVLYMCDGQNLFGQASTLSGYEWECDESVLSLMGNGGDGVIVVGIEAGSPSSRRDHELTPNLGTPVSFAGSSFVNGGGKVFSDFVVDTVIPYVEKNYNTNSYRGVAGSSSGGIEAFYIGVEHMDKFRYIGALSPAFILYDQATWNKYLKTKDFSGNVPRIYFFCGNSSQDQLEQALYLNATAMEGWLKKLGYPTDRMVTVTDADATHSEGFWAVYFPEMLSWGMDV